MGGFIKLPKYVANLIKNEIVNEILMAIFQSLQR